MLTQRIEASTGTNERTAIYTGIFAWSQSLSDCVLVDTFSHGRRASDLRSLKNNNRGMDHRTRNRQKKEKKKTKWGGGGGGGGE